MTLTNLKKHFKLASIVTLLVFYGVFFYLLGSKSPNLSNMIKNKNVKPENKIQNSETFEKPFPYSDNQSGQVIASSVKLCSNTFYGFEIAYPQDWFTTYDSDDQKCTLFAPFSFVIYSKPENTQVPIKVEVVKTQDWIQTVKYYENPNDFQNIISIQNIQLANRGLEKIKAVATGAGVIPKGFQKISYLIFDSKTPLVLYYQQQTEKDDISEFEKILEEMITSLKYY